jgi:hypothetical protein
MTEQPGWYTCPTCNRVLYADTVCDTPECVEAAKKAKPTTAPEPESAPAQ